MGDQNGGLLFIGEKGVLMSGCFGSGARLVPETMMKAYKRPDPTIERVPGAKHEQDWLRACKTGKPAGSNFDFAGPFTESVLMGNLAIRHPNHELLWDGEKMEVSNDKDANAYVRRNYRKGWSLYFLVDPLDGTKEFVKRNGQFTVNIALMEDGVPVAGVVYAPDLDWMYYGSRDGSFKQEGTGEPIRLNPSNERGKEKIVIVGSRSHPSQELDDFVTQMKAEYGEVEFTAMGSSLKLCTVAEGKADVYPRLGPTMEWDTAAAHAVVTHSGRRVLAWGEDDQDLPYNKPDLLNGWFVVR